MKFWVLYLLIASYVVAQCCRYISMKITNEQNVIDSQGQETKFRHPLFQSCVGFLGEFVVIAVLYVYYMLTNAKEIVTAQIRFKYFFLPAVCDFAENTLLVFGLTAIFPSVTTMSRALVVPITAIISKYLILTRLSWNQVGAMAVAIGGVFLAALSQLQNEYDDPAHYKVTLWGLFLLVLSAGLQAMETMLENRLFKIEPDLSAFTMQTAVAFWKLVMVILLIPIAGKIPSTSSMVEGGKMENIQRAFAEISDNKTVCALICFQVIACGLQSFLGVLVIKESNGILKQAVTLFIIPIIWGFFLFYPGSGGEKFELESFLGMLFTIGGTIWYIYADREQLEEQEEVAKAQAQLGEKYDEQPLMEDYGEKEIVSAPQRTEEKKNAKDYDLVSEGSSAHFSSHKSDIEE